MRRHEKHEGIYVDYSNTDGESIFTSDMQRTSFFQSLHGTGTRLFSFDTTRFPLRELVERRLLNLGLRRAGVDLEHLHLATRLDDQTMDWSGHSPISLAFYEPDSDFDDAYRRLVKETVAQHVIDAPVYFQVRPTFRFSFPGSPGYTWRPNFHSDVALGHPPQEINIWVPLTQCLEPNGLIYADLEDSLAVWTRFDFNFARFHETLDDDDELYAHCEQISKPLACDYGDLFAFDCRCMHLSQINRSDQTRISIDFRVLPVSEFEQMELEFTGTGRSHARFEPGSYYDARTSSEL